MSTIFTKIINKEIPAQFVYEDDICVAVMDKFPAVEGQTLVILKDEIDYLFDVPEEKYNHLFNVAKKIAKASDIAFNTIRTCLLVEGFEVPHVHIKLYPKTTQEGVIGESSEGPSAVEDEYLQKQADKIKAALNEI